jgi:DNA segregation ATPase FtsK/SpoIIIE-like protein
MALKFFSKQPTTNVSQIMYLNQDTTFENVEAFVRERGKAACSELMAAFRLTYRESVVLMDALEARGIVKPIPTYPDGSPSFSGPRIIAA